MSDVTDLMPLKLEKGPAGKTSICRELQEFDVVPEPGLATSRPLITLGTAGSRLIIGRSMTENIGIPQ